MAEASKIEWTDATWNPITGCTLVSEGCRNCYAATLAATRLQHHPSRAGLARLNTARGRYAKPPAFIVDPSDGTVHCFMPANPNRSYRAMVRVGKTAAGRLLDGVTHDGWP